MALYKSVYYYYYYYFIFFLTPVLNSQGMKKIMLYNTEKYKNQAGINHPSHYYYYYYYYCLQYFEAVG